VDTAQALLDRRHKALRRKKAGFERLMRNYRDLDVEVVSGKPSRADRQASAPVTGPRRRPLPPRLARSNG
jgi:hypothetical protein